MNQYELAYIVDAEIAEDKREAIVKAITNLIQSVKAEPGELETWGKRDFTFPIQKKTAGVYYLQYFQAAPEVLADLERRLRIDTAIMRYILVRHAKNKPKKNQKRLGRTRQTEG